MYQALDPNGFIKSCDMSSLSLSLGLTVGRSYFSHDFYAATGYMSYNKELLLLSLIARFFTNLK